jgi:hypothetical protein
MPALQPDEHQGRTDDEHKPENRNTRNEAVLASLGLTLPRHPGLATAVPVGFVGHLTALLLWLAVGLTNMPLDSLHGAYGSRLCVSHGEPERPWMGRSVRSGS